jgi:hypothetical protein
MSAEPTLHHQLAAGRWHTLSLLEQMAHVGSEVERAIRAHESARTERWGAALARACELFDLTAADPRWQGPRLREILRAREEFCRLFFANDNAPGAADSLRKYFLHFAIAARRTGR